MGAGAGLHPYALGLYAVLLLVGALLAVRGHRARRVAGGLLALIATAGLGAHTAWFLPQISGPVPAAQGPTITVMTVNGSSGQASAPEVVEKALSERVDILVLQEVSEVWWGRLVEAGAEELFEYRSPDPTPGRGIVVLSRLPLGETTPVPGVAALAVPVRTGGDDLALVAVHPRFPLRPQRWVSTHQALRSWVAEHPPDLIVGDFNATADHRPMRALDRAGYRSTTELTNEGWHPTWPAERRFLGILPLPALVQIDHVLCGPSLTATRSWTVRIGDSDHRGLIAEVAPR